LKDAADKLDDRDRRHSPDDDDYYHRSSRGGGYSDREVGRPRSALGGSGAGGALSVPTAGDYALDYGPHHTGDPATDSSSDLGSSSGEEKERKSAKRKALLTAGLATVATIHAGHSVYQSFEKRDVRRKLLKEGDISPEQAKREKNKARLQDAASIGIAALGVKGAVSEWKEMNEKRGQAKEAEERYQRHSEKRANRRRKLEEEARRLGTHPYSGSMPNLPTGGDGYYGGGPQYYDDNPYSASAALPPPHSPYEPRHGR